MEEPNDASVPFQWGIKRGLGGSKRDVQFYESFTFDGVHYKLYDNVYLFKKGETEPYIGKIVKIWEQGDKKKKVKILWFFEASDISSYLGDFKPTEKEIFLACGEGVGLANINPLEAIAGKCSVICTSEDSRNPPPSKAALDRADFIFSHTFDVGTLAISGKLPDKISGIEVKLLLNQSEDQDVGKADTVEANCGDDGVASLKQKAQEDLSNDKPAKKMRLDDNSEKKQLSEKKKSSDELPQKVLPEKSKSSEAEQALGRKNKEAENVSGKKNKEAEPAAGRDNKEAEHARGRNNKEAEHARGRNNKEAEHVPGRNNTEIEHASGRNNTEAEHQIVVARKPDADRSKWFKGISWDSRLHKANQQGMLMFLQNFDRSLASRDIEDMIYHSFKHSCTAKVIPLLPPYHNPHYGQAYVVFKTQDAVDDTIQKINAGCLMVQNRSALIASKGLLKIPQKPSTLVGHLAINKVKKMQREELRKAVSTSHCSQPNTIEYEMAMEWILVQEKTATCFNQLYKRHGDDGRKVRKQLKSNK